MKLEEAKKKLDYHKNIIASLDEKSGLFEAIKTVLQALDNSISKDKVKEKIEELNKNIDLSIDNSKGGLDEDFIDKGTKLLAQKRILEELLEDK